MPYSRVYARDIMNAEPPCCLPGLNIHELAQRFADENITGLLVVDEDQSLIGVVTETDLIDQQKNLHVPTAVALFDMVIPMGESQFEEELTRLKAITAGELASVDVKTVGPDVELSEIASIMGDNSVHHLPVLDGDVVIGLICKHDVIKALVTYR
ncbi:CBS domain-containing protein [Mariprofundus erugo]|uniref:CBS domain-containing protein n=1 Tax=Mariprofundus erugo TaxID=2528639 RepID=UPI0010FE5703|nr:CBS domain-containing protein [Mariprofundus erugo]TLS74772.1 CBS domain-containing protein [Mariprofundus erugo]